MISRDESEFRAAPAADRPRGRRRRRRRQASPGLRRQRVRVAPVAAAPGLGDRARSSPGLLDALAAAPRRAVRSRLGAEGRLSAPQGAARRDAGAALALLSRASPGRARKNGAAGARAVRAGLRAFRGARDPALSRQPARRACPSRSRRPVDRGAGDLGLERRLLAARARRGAPVLPRAGVDPGGGRRSCSSTASTSRTLSSASPSRRGSRSDRSPATSAISRPPWCCRRSWRRPSSRAASGSALAAVALALCLYGLIVTQTFSAIAGVAVGTIVFWGFQIVAPAGGHRRRGGRRRGRAGARAGRSVARAQPRQDRPGRARRLELRADRQARRLAGRRLDGGRAPAHRRRRRRLSAPSSSPRRRRCCATASCSSSIS